METRKESSDLRSILGMQTYEDPVSENSLIIAERADFIRMSGHKFYIDYSVTPNATTAKVCEQCDKEPFIGFIVRIKQHPLGSNLAIYQCDNCQMIQLVALKSEQLGFFFPK